MNPPTTASRFARLRRRAGGILLALAAFVFLSAEDLQIEESELECEQAVAHVSRCCPNFDTKQLYCVYTACGRQPDLTISEARCLQARSCDEIAAMYCDLATRVQLDTRVCP